ncbi:hypothetical protein MKW98_030579 [Papaver atlanticum]|uniref:Oberon PHD finger domain-containing protein n=1 Tax=Papaver atlanticum TaxID=357466 RepID=A0AAD4SK84_9MAGN|nr:hypothetical protein MKW98_030579 [Papaver atlanticum]
MADKIAMILDDPDKDNGSEPGGVKDVMILDDPDKDSGSAAGGVGEIVLVLRPVGLGESGEGMPYAPENWPKPGDNWRWRVGRRTLLNGYMWDRFLIPPARLLKPRKSGQRKVVFPSIQGVAKFLQEEIPNADVDAFFKSFCWKIPSNEYDWQKDQLLYPIIPLRGDSAEVEHSGHESNTSTVDCKARNIMCVDQREARSNSLSLPDMDCDICCSEVNFCRNCYCILCSNIIDWTHGGYSFIRCEAKQGEDYICGHAAHLDCALRSYMAGKVGGSIGLDVEYYCRRCDKITDLIPHVTRLLQTCQSLNSPDEIEKILKLGLSIVRGSQRVGALNLLNSIELAFRKLKSGIYLDEIWNMEGDISEISPGAEPHIKSERPVVENKDVSAGSYSLNVGASDLKAQKSSQEPLYITSDHQIESVKLEKEVEQVLQELKKSQQVEYETAKAKLYAKKRAILDLYQKLDAEKYKLDNRSSSSKNSDMDTLLTSILNRVSEIKQELISLKDMVRIARGFGRTPTGILKEHFGLQNED